MSLLDVSKYKKYKFVSKTLERVVFNWRDLSIFDGALTEKWVDDRKLKAHKIEICSYVLGNNVNELKDALEMAYRTSRQSVILREVEYSKDDKQSFTYTPLGVFAKEDIEVGLEIDGLIGVLADIKEEDLIENFISFSVIYSSRVGLQWLMLGPISFVYASCVPNVAYVRLGKVMACAPMKNIKRGEELVISYHKHFFGPYNIDCKCRHESFHGDPFPDHMPPRKKKKSEVFLTEKLIMKE